VTAKSAKSGDSDPAVSTWKLGYRPALDGLRALAVILVILAHARVPGFRMGGQVGVTMFFALSGFLITTLLVEERDRSGRIDLRAFYMRRALRLLPAIIVFVAVVSAQSLLRGEENVWRNAAGALFYYGNWLRALTGTDLALLSHTWSLSIEEQFYIVWPAILLCVLALSGGGLRWLLILSAVGVFASVAVTQLLVADGALVRVQFGSDTRADGLLIGCILALLIVRRQPPKFGVWPAAVALASLAALVAVFVEREFSFRWGQTLAATATAVLIASLLQPSWLTRVFSLRPLVFCGQISYGLYLWHFPILYGLTPVLWKQIPYWPRIIFLISLSYLVAVVSYYVVERRFLERKAQLGEARWVTEDPPRAERV